MPREYLYILIHLLDELCKLVQVVLSPIVSYSWIKKYSNRIENGENEIEELKVTPDFTELNRNYMLPIQN